MDINYFREFVVLAQTGNFMEAAELLFCSQSTLSKHIKKMERELGVSLFDRTTRNVEISKFGQLLLPYAQQITALQDKYTALLQGYLDTEQEILNLGSIPDLAQYRITDVLVDFRKNYAPSVINVIQAGTEKLKELLRQKRIMLAFIRVTDEVDDDLIELPYAIDTMVALFPTSHPLAIRKTIPLTNLSEADFLLMESGSRLYRLSLNACKQCGFEPKIAYTDQKLGNLVDMVGKGMGVALVMKHLVEHLASPDIAIVDIAPCVTTSINLAYLKGQALTDAARAFIACMEAQRDRLDLLNEGKITWRQHRLVSPLFIKRM